MANRQLIRQKQRNDKKKDIKYQMSVEQLKALSEEFINKQRDELIKETMMHTIRDLTAALILSLMDEFGFGQKRISKLLKKCNGIFDDINSGLITIDDIKGELKRIGMEFETFYQEQEVKGK